MRGETAVSWRKGADKPHASGLRQFCVLSRVSSLARFCKQQRRRSSPRARGRQHSRTIHCAYTRRKIRQQEFRRKRRQTRLLRQRDLCGYLSSRFARAHGRRRYRRDCAKASPYKRTILQWQSNKPFPSRAMMLGPVAGRKCRGPSTPWWMRCIRETEGAQRATDLARNSDRVRSRTPVEERRQTVTGNAP